MFIHILITALFLLIFGWIVLRHPFFRDPLIPRKAFLGAFILKFLAGLLLWAVYSFHYPMKGHSDAFNYFKEAMTLHEALSEDPEAYFDILLGTGYKEADAQKYIVRTNHWKKPYNYGVMNDNRTIIRANMICRWFSFGYYHVHTAIFCFISFLGLMALYKAFLRFLPKKGYGAFFATFLIPSLVFWGSGVLKEGILLFGMGFFVHYWLKVLEDHRWRAFLPALFFSLLLVSIKTYVLLALVPGLLSYALVVLLRYRYTIIGFLAVHGGVAAIALLIPRLGVPYDIVHMLSLKQKDFYNVAKEHDAGSVFKAPEFSSFSEVLIAAPEALWNTLFRPHLFEMEKLLYIPPAFENLFLLLLLIPAAWFWKSPSRGVLPFFLWACSFVLILGTVIGLTTPVLGAIVRYQIPLLPFYIFVILASIDDERWERGIEKLRGLFGNRLYGKEV